MICTFGDLTDVTWWRELRAARPRPSSGATAGCRGDPPVAHCDRDGRRRVRRARRARRSSRRANASSSCCASAATSLGDPKPITHPVKFYEKGDRPLEIVTTPPVVHPQRRPRPRPRATRCSRAARELQLAPAVHAGPLRELGRGPQRRLADQPPALLRRAVPGLVPARRRRRARLRPAARSRPRTRCRSTRRPTSPTATTEDQRGQPGGFIGDPDVMDTWATSSLTPQIACALGGRPRPVRPHVPDGPAPAGPRDHPHVAVLDASCARTSSTARCRGTTPRSRAGSSTPTARRCRSRRATSSRRCTLLEQYGSDAVRYWAASGAARHRHRVRRGPDEGRPPARHQAAQRVEVRARRDRRRARRHAGAVTEPLDRAMLGRARRPRRRGHRRLRGLRLRPRARAHRAVLLVVLRRLRRAGEGARVRRRGASRRGVGPGRAARSRSTRCCGCSRRSCRSSPKRCGRGGGDGSIHRAAGPTRRRCAAVAGDAPTPASTRSPPRCSARSARRRPRPSGRCAPTSPRRRPRHRRAARGPRRRGRRRPRGGPHRRASRRSSPTRPRSRWSLPSRTRPDPPPARGDAGEPFTSLRRRARLARRARQPREGQRRRPRRGPADAWPSSGSGRSWRCSARRSSSTRRST